MDRSPVLKVLRVIRSTSVFAPWIWEHPQVDVEVDSNDKRMVV